MKLITRISIVALLFVGLSSYNTHKFYVSLTKVAYNQEAETLEVISKIFIDDIEDVLNERYETETYLDTNKETERDRELLKKYILKKLKLEVNGEKATLNYLGIDYDTDVVKVYIEVPNIKECTSIGVENTMLMEKFEDQQNIIHFKVGDTKRSLVLEKENPNGLLKFSE